MADLIDPTDSTSLAFNRKTLLGFGAGAAAFASSITAALAQADGFGAPHPPIVPEDDPAIVVEHVRLARPDIALEAYAARPNHVTPATPGIVMVQAIWGVDAQLRDTVRRYAKEGYLCIAPSLYQRSHPPSGDGRSDIAAFAPQAQALKDDVVMGDLLAGREWLRSTAAQSKIGITGFCMGGGIVIKQLIGTHAYDAASVFYGDVRPGVPRDAPTTPDTFAYAKQIATPVRGNYGARDTSIKPDDVRAMFAELSVPHSLDIYDDAGHAFFDDTRNRYVARAAADAWSKTLAWFRTYLT